MNATNDYNIIEEYLSITGRPAATLTVDEFLKLKSAESGGAGRKVEQKESVCRQQDIQENAIQYQTTMKNTRSNVDDVKKEDVMTKDATPKKETNNAESRKSAFALMKAIPG